MRVLFIALVVIAALSASVARADVQVSDTAKLHFEMGVNHLQRAGGPNYQAAYESFHKAYADSPHPIILSNIGHCAMNLERDGEAIDAYEKFLAEMTSIEPAEKAKVESDLVELRARGASFVFSIAPVGALIVDERVTPDGSIMNRYVVEEGTLELRVRAGTHKVRVEADAHAPAEFEADLAAGDKYVRKIALERTVPLEPAPKITPDPSPDPTPGPTPMPEPSSGGGVSAASIAMLVTTGALGIGAIVVGALALKTKSDYESYQDGGDRQDAENVRATGEALNIVTDVLIVTTAAAAVVSIVLLVTTTGSKDTAALRLRPSAGGITLDGAF